ncbi:MAG: glycosyltransferase family 39 protein [Ktedonobacteraceae bacterium]|nr:glycosyltransferase family 39 protein [Ktedonobacteraceae bacterium]
MSRRKGISLRFPRFNVYWIGALIIIALAIAIRVWLIALRWPLLDSDEGTMGLMGMHIAFKGETPTFFYDQNYMGAAEAYLAAFMFRLFGISAFTLRLGMILLFALFLLFMYLLTSLLFSKKWALITLLLLALGSDAILTRELVAVGGDAETLVAGTLILLLSIWLSLSAQDGTKRKRRLLAYAGCGLAAGFGVWSHLLVVPFILMGAIILLLFCRREIFNRGVLKCISWPILTLIATFIIGALPLIIYNVQNPDKNIFVTFWNIHRVSSISGISSITSKPFYVLLPYQLRGAFQISLPTATGTSPLCPVTTRPDGVAVLQAHAISFSSRYAIECTLSHTVWPLGVVTLWILATLLALYSLKPYWRRFIPSQWPPEEKPFVVRQVGRLSLLAVAGITFALFAFSPNAALFPVATSRYLIGLLVATPALLWPFWSGINAVKPLALRVAQVTVAVRLARISVLLRRGLLLLIGINLLLGTINTFTGIFPTPPVAANQDIFATQAIDQHLNLPDTLIYNRDERGLIKRLSVLKIRYIYSDYWTCDRLIFQTREKIICSTIQATDQNTFCAGVQDTNTLHLTNSEAAKNIRGQNRYPLYVREVGRYPEAATYVLQDNSTLANLMAHCASTSRIIYTKDTANRYTIYQPTNQRRTTQHT